MAGEKALQKSTIPSCISFTVNGKLYTVTSVDPNKTLSTWLRENCLTSAKVMCREGGCGACVVAVGKINEPPKVVNSCLMPLCSADGRDIVTADGAGSLHHGFNDIQKRFTKFGATQCGYCTPGFIVSMHSLLAEEKGFTQHEVEDYLDGNMCRCTGYRSILDAAKSFASDADEALVKQCSDIEDYDVRKCAKRCKRKCDVLKARRPGLRMDWGGTSWVRPDTMAELTSFVTRSPLFVDSSCFVCANTSTGIYKRSARPSLLIDLTNIPDLTRTGWSERDGLTLGACVNLNQACQALLARNDAYQVHSRVTEHLRKVASNPVRNMASWAGNLMIKYRHREFPSDVAILLECVAARVRVLDAGGAGTCQDVAVFGAGGLMGLDMTRKVIVSVLIPLQKPAQPDSDLHFRSYKVMPRSQNAHAYINAAFKFEVSSAHDVIRDDITIVFGNVRPDFCHAAQTEKFLRGKLINQETFRAALKILMDELKPIQHDPVDSSVEHKRTLAASLFYRYWLSMTNAEDLSPEVRSGADPLMRPLSSGCQSYSTDLSTYPVSEPIPKISSLIQASGEAYYLSDKPPTTNELHCAFVCAEVANCDLDVVDGSFASRQPGFVQLITGANFPVELKNSRFGDLDASQPLLTPGHIEYAGQPVALVLAETDEQARSIAATVDVSYKNRRRPVLTTRDAIGASSFYDLNIPDITHGDAVGAIATAKHKISGEVHLESPQYHFYMETQYARAELTDEGGFLMESATQTQLWTQQVLSYVYGIPRNKVEVQTKRLGGAYGGKATNSLIATLAAALGAYCSRRPCRFHADLRTCMTTFGSRTPFSLHYTVGVDDEGLLQGVDWTVFCNSGCSHFDGEADDDSLFTISADSAYYCPNRKIARRMCKTNTVSTTWCRAPGSFQLTGFADVVMEHVAAHLRLDPIQVKMTNMYVNGQRSLDGSLLSACHLRELCSSAMQKAKVEERRAEIDNFNSAHKWKKRGLAITPLKYALGWYDFRYQVLMAIQSGDGSVVVSHGGIESGQGIDTKVAQVTARQLTVPVDSVLVQRTSTTTSCNSEFTGASTTSELVCRSAMECCDTLNSRIAPIRAKLPASATWPEVIRQCFKEGVNLMAACVADIDLKTGTRYHSYGVTCAEVELDVLTGAHLISRVDITFDCGISLNPMIDIGQVEGAFVMGLGFWLSERFVYDPDSGRILNPGTWEYKPPTPKDIPVEWNIELVKNRPNPTGFLNSKASGEPPMCMSVAVLHALRHCVVASRRDRALDDAFFVMPQPATTETVTSLLQLDPLEHFTLR